jgi:hypothetical protein
MAKGKSSGHLTRKSLSRLSSGDRSLGRSGSMEIFEYHGYKMIQVQYNWGVHLQHKLPNDYLRKVVFDNNLRLNYRRRSPQCSAESEKRE